MELTIGSPEQASEIKIGGPAWETLTCNGHYRRNQTTPEFLREIVWFGFLTCTNK